MFLILFFGWSIATETNTIFTDCIPLVGYRAIVLKFNQFQPIFFWLQIESFQLVTNQKNFRSVVVMNVCTTINHVKYCIIEKVLETIGDYAEQAGVNRMFLHFTFLTYSHCGTFFFLYRFPRRQNEKNLLVGKSS